MNKHTTIISKATSPQKKNNEQKFWLWTVCMYAVAEAAYWIIYYFTNYIQCTSCVYPFAFFIVQWLLSVMCTAIVWIVLNRFNYKNRWLIIVLNIVLFIAYYFVWMVIKYALYNSALTANKRNTYSLQDIIYTSWFDIGKYVLTASAFYVLQFYVKYKQAAEQRIQLAIINKHMQLNLLKHQLSPHFYFNTLNNLYGLAKKNSAKLSPALHQLQNIMQYVLTECDQPKVLLKKEIDFLQSYIALEKLRYEENTMIDMRVTGNANGHTILPLLLIQFVENAFKHGMKEKSEQSWMRVNITIENNELYFLANNSCHTPAFTEGVGFSSVKHRLSLQYEGKYEMTIKNENEEFAVFLKLNLS